MKSSTNRALVAKKQSTSFAQVANNLLNVLQGYTKGIRLLLVMFLTLTVTTNAWAQYTKASSIAVGDVVVLVYESGNTKMELSSFSTTSTIYGIGASYSTTPAGKYELTVEAGSSSGTYSLKNGDKYLYWNSGNSLATSGSKTTNSSWTITFNNGNAVIKNANTTTRQIYWNTGSPRFACYTSAQASVQLYKKTSTDPYTVTFNAGSGTCGDESLTETSGGAGVTLPTANPFAACATDGWEFAGWKETSAVSTETTTAPTLLSAGSIYKPTNNCTLYAVYQRTETTQGGGSTTHAFGWENADDESKWTISNFSAKGVYSTYKSAGSYAASTNSKTTGYIQYTEKLSPTDISCKYTKATSNTNSSSKFIIQTSTDGSSWTDAATGATMNNVTLGTFKTLSWTGSLSDVYVRIYYTGTNTVRVLDEVSITATGGGGSTTYYHSSPTCGPSCTAPTSVTVTPTNEFGWRYSIGETISLKATYEGGAGTPSYQWQKYIEDTWTNIDGATAATYTKTNCTTSDGGSYRCVVSTGTNCSLESEGYFVRVFTLNGGYTTDGEWTAHKIVWTSENTGLVTLSLLVSETYYFKVTDNDGKWFGYGDASNYIIQPWQADCGTGNSNIRLFTGPAGDYKFTINIEYAQENSPYVNIKVDYPEVTHPVEGYAYINKWWDCYVHYWEGASTALTEWGSDPKINDDRYVNICGTDYWYFPVIETYTNFIAKDNAGNPENTTGDQSTTNHSGQNITHNGNAWVWQEFSTYSITFNGNGNTGGTMTDVTGITCGGLATLTQNTFTRTGYTFAGWATSADGEKVYNDQATISNITSNITLYAKWTPNDNTAYTVKHYTQQLDGTYSATPDETENLAGTTAASVTPAVKSYTGFSAPSAQTVTIAADGSTVVTYQYTRNSYTLTWNLDGGTIITQGTAAGEVKYGAALTAPTVTKTGYTFAGWHNGTAIVTPATIMPANDLTYTAQWTKVYTVTFYSNGSVYETLTDLESGATVVFPTIDPISCDTETYPHFIGWTINPIDGSTTTQPELVENVIVTGDCDYYAVFAKGEGGSSDYKLVTSAPADWSGTYLIVNTDDKKAWKGSATSDNGAIDVTITDNTITSNATTDNETFTIATMTGGYSIKGTSGKYISGTSGNNTTNYNNAAQLNTISIDNDNNVTITSNTSVLRQNNTTASLFRYYKSSSYSSQHPIQLYKKGSGVNYTSFITSCCQSPAVVTVTPADASLELNIDGTASTEVNISQTGGGSGRYYEPTVSPADGASHNWAGSYKTQPYDINFTATKAGTYTVTGNFTETSYGCQKTGSATINVVANPILLASVEELTFTPTCGQNSVSQEVEINSRYLTSDNITATVATTSGSGKFTISTDNTTFGTSNLTLSGGTITKVTDQIYVRYEAEEGETGAVAGTLTLQCGSTQKVINLTGTCTCSANVTITGGPIQITAAKDIWVEAATELTVTGTFLTTNADNANVSIRAYTNNAAFQIKTGGTTGEGTANALTLGTNISNPDWTGNIGIVYKPTQANTTETATLTVEVYRHNGTTVYSTATYDLEGRSLPEQFVIAVTNGSDDWFAVPADMVAPWGNACSGLGTFAPYPISVNNTTAPTIASNVPARAVYQAAARTGNVNTNPQTMSYKSVPLGDEPKYYLYGSSTSVDSDGNNTNIQNASFAASEKQKWFLDVVDWDTKQYNMHVHSSLTTNVLAYTTAGGTNRVGQYSATAGTTKKSIYLLPINGTTCTYYAAPVVEVMAIDATNATIQFKNDRTTAYEISLDQNTWTDLPVTLIKDCNNSEEATQLQAQLSLATYRGQTVYIRAKVTTGTACQETGSIVVPNPTIDRGETPWEYTGTAGQAFSNNSKSITISDLWNPLSVSVAQQTTNSNIQASITPEGVVTVSMAAEDATEGVHQAILQFISDGASFVDNGKGSPQYVGVVITLHSLAEMNFDGGDGVTFTETSPIMLCKNAIDENDATPTIYLSYPLYKDGTAISSTSELNETEFTLIDINTGSELSFSREGSDGGIASVTFNASTIAAMIPGHTYRLSWENTNQVMTNVGGLPYMDCYMDFIYSENCDAPTALAACPITNSSFTANWVGDATKLNVYTKSETEVLAAAMTETTINVWKSYNNSYADKWLGASSDGTGNITKSSTYGAKVAGSGESGYIYTPQLGTLKADMTNSTEFEVTITVYHYNSNSNKNSIKCFVIDGEPTNTTEPTSGNNVYFNGTQNTSWTSTTFGNVNTTDVTFIVSGLTSTSRIAITATNRINSTYVENVTIKSVATSSVGEYDVTGTSHDISGLSANTTYYYTVTDGSSNTSNEIAVTTYSAAPTLKYYSDEGCTTEITETTVLGGEETTVYVKGTRVPACDITPIISSGYGMDYSNISYTTGTGVVSGSIKLTLADANTTEGTLTITDAKGNDYVLYIVSSDCPAGFGTMASVADNITNESAYANWRNTLEFGDDKSGTLQLYKNGIVNRELIVNGDFETGSLTAGWSNGLNEGDMGAVYSFEEYAIANSNAHGGSNCLSVTGNGSKLPAFQNMSVMYADYITLTPGTYRMSAWVKMLAANNQYLDKKQSFALGLIGGKKSEVKVVCVSDTTILATDEKYHQLTYTFEITSTVTACPAIGANVDGDTFRDFYLDDVSLMCTSIGQGEEPYLSIDIADLSAAGNLALTGLSGNTEYTYIIQNADGCSSNAITFQTIDAGAPQLSVTTPVSIAAPLGGSAKGVATVTATDAYSTINVTLADNEQRIRLNATTIPAAGGVVQFTFTPLNTDYPGTTGSDTVTLTTQGMANPVELIINWAVTSGIDVNTPMVEVTEISNEQITIEHNVNLGNELDVRIIMNRPITDDEKEANVGDEIFFSKYYEAYMHKKLWAIFNPTAQKRSLAGMQVWRSKSNYEDWNTAPENIIDLSEMGNHEKGWIYPNEEIIVYTADQVGECERSKADMSNWVAMSSSNLPVSFSGDDALLLVRNANAVDPAKNNQPPTTSINGDDISWRIYTDSVSQKWYMLDLIGARTDQNKPDGSATRSWSWTDCSTTPAKTEAGDAKGWVGYGYDLADNKIKYNSCEGEGYILSTNRCLLIRRMNVKSGANAVTTNIGDMVTLNSEWKGSHVPKDGNQEQTSCENFSYVGGYDYDGYYNAWVPLDEDEFVYASQNEDGTYTFDMDVPHYYCDTMRIEVVEKVTVNGVESDNIHAYNLYKVPIVVDVDANTRDEKFFHYPERPSDDLDTPPIGIVNEKILTDDICTECDVVIRDAAELTHTNGGQGQFRNIMVYPGAKLNNTIGQAFRLQGLHIQALNDTVGYAIINNDQSSIVVDTIIHTKRINDQYWYIFSLPYDCNVAAIRQLNGKSMGDYGKDWGIQYYNGKARQEAGTSAAPGAVSNFWRKVDASDTLKANEAYIIGLFTTQWTNQHKTIYFPPTESTQYTESGNEAKETNVYNWNVNLAAEKRHHGWNFVGSPYISIFDPNGKTDAGVNNGNVVIKGEIQADGSYTNDTEVFVSIPDGSNARTYTQQRAASTKLEPFKGYFIQVVDPTSGEDETKTLQYSKTERTLSNNAPARKAQAAREKVVVELELVAFDNQVDYAGVLVDDSYKPEYEISGDLVKMYAAASKPQLYLRDMTNEQMAYIALPDAQAENIPLEFYAPKMGNYTLALNQQKSRIHGAKTIELLYNGEVVANLMFDTYTIAAQKGVNKGYSIRIQRVAQVITSIDNVSMEGITIATTEGYITIEGLPTGAQVMLYDMVGKLIKADYEMNGIVNFDAPTQGVYEISIQTAQGNNCVKTIIR